MHPKTLVTVVILFVVITLGSIVVASFFETTDKNNSSVNTPQSSASSTALPSSLAISSSQTKNTYTLNEITQHNSSIDCWVILDKEVLNVSPYLYQHPGGASAIIPYCGADITSAFNAQRKHANFAKNLAHSYKIGILE